MPSFPFPPGYLGGPDKYQFGVLISLLSIGAFFAALVLAFVLMVPQQTVQFRVTLPGILWVSTLLISASSVAFESARYAVRRARMTAYRSHLLVTLALGGIFIICQLVSWQRLHAQQIPLQGNPRGFAFYTFTGVHAAHLLLGMLGLIFLIRRAAQVDSNSEQSLRRHRRLNGAIGLYWHSMGLLWFGLFALLLAWSG